MEDETEYKIRQHYIIEVPDDINESKLNPFEYYVYCKLLYFSKEKCLGNDMGVKNMAEKCGISVTKLKKCLKKLSEFVIHEKPLISIVKRKSPNGANIENKIIINWLPTKGW